MDDNKKQFLKRLIISGVAIVLVLALVYIGLHLLGWDDLTREEIQDIVSSTGALAPVVFVLISFLQVTFVPLPNMVTILAGNYMFGFWESFLYSYLGSLAGTMFAFGLGRWFGRRFVNWIAGDSQKVDEWMKKLKGREKVLLFFMFLLPLFPDDLLCAVAGLFPMRWTYFLTMQLITRFTSIGGTLLFMSGEIIPFRGWGLIVLALVAVVLAVAFVVCFKYAQQIDEKANELYYKIFKRKNQTKKD